MIEAIYKFNKLLRLINKENSFISRIIDVNFIKFIVSLFNRYPTNNFLHNAISQLLTDVINNDMIAETIFCNQAGLIQFIMDQADSRECYTIHLHHIASAIIGLKNTEVNNSIRMHRK